jgi:hypothetical protein
MATPPSRGLPQTMPTQRKTSTAAHQDHHRGLEGGIQSAAAWPTAGTATVPSSQQSQAPPHLGRPLAPPRCPAASATALACRHSPTVSCTGPDEPGRAEGQARAPGAPPPSRGRASAADATPRSSSGPETPRRRTTTKDPRRRRQSFYAAAARGRRPRHRHRCQGFARRVLWQWRTGRGEGESGRRRWSPPCRLGLGNAGAERFIDSAFGLASFFLK